MHCDAHASSGPDKPGYPRRSRHLQVDEGAVAEAQLDGLQQLRQQLVVRLAADPRMPRTHVERAAQQLLAVCACARRQQRLFSQEVPARSLQSGRGDGAADV